MSKIEDYELQGIDIALTDRLIAQPNSGKAVALAAQQAMTAIGRSMVHKYQPEMEFLSETPSGHTDKCSVDEPHSHMGIQFRVVPLELLEEMKAADVSG